MKNSVDFTYSKDTDEKRVKHLKSHKTKLMMVKEKNEALKELFESLLSRYQIELEKSVEGSDFFGCIDLLYCKCHKTSLSCGELNIDSPD